MSVSKTEPASLSFLWLHITTWAILTVRSPGPPPPRSQLSQGLHFVSPKFMQVGCRAPNSFFVSLRAEDVRSSGLQVDIPVYCKTMLRQSCGHRPLGSVCHAEAGLEVRALQTAGSAFTGRWMGQCPTQPAAASQGFSGTCLSCEV